MMEQGGTSEGVGEEQEYRRYVDFDGSPQISFPFGAALCICAIQAGFF